jgi:hypothetical protein
VPHLGIGMFLTALHQKVGAIFLSTDKWINKNVPYPDNGMFFVNKKECETLRLSCLVKRHG